MRILTMCFGAWGLLLGTSCTAPRLTGERTATPGAFEIIALSETANRAGGQVGIGAGDDSSAPAPVPALNDASRSTEVSEPATRAAVEKALPVLWQGVEGHAKHRSCFTCHNHGTSMLAFATARGRGFDVPEKDIADQIEFISDYLESSHDRFLHGFGPGPLSLGGGTDTTGWALFALDVAGKTPDGTTAAVVEYTLLKHKSRDHWGTSGPSRPPAEQSDFMPTALAIRGLQAFGLPEHKERIAIRVESARGWLLKTPAHDTEDRVFRLLGLKAAGAQTEEIRKAGEELVKTQRADGGWGQTDAMASDAYATGSALVALQIGAEISVVDPTYRRGLAYLLHTQLADGSWRVRSRSLSLQPYYESGFPHGNDQFISCAATGWATTALVLACPKK